jgi:hypothetical protein
MAQILHVSICGTPVRIGHHRADAADGSGNPVDVSAFARIHAAPPTGEGRSKSIEWRSPLVHHLRPLCGHDGDGSFHAAEGVSAVPTSELGGGFGHRVRRASNVCVQCHRVRCPQQASRIVHSGMLNELLRWKEVLHGLYSSILLLRIGRSSLHFFASILHFLRPMSLQLLASVEVQLCAHFLDSKSILRLARCSRRLHADCDSDFAWKYALPFSVSCYSPDLLATFRSVLARRAGLALHWFSTPTDERRSHSQLHPAAQEVVAIPRLRELRFDMDSKRMNSCLHVLSHPNVRRHLRVLRFENVINNYCAPPEVLSMIGGMPALTTFEFRCSYNNANLAPLLSCPSLTDLSVQWPAGVDALFPSLELFTQLRRLTLRGVCFSSGQLQTLFNFDSMKQLQHLSLCQVDLRPTGNEVQPSEFATFAAQAHLESLNLNRVTGAAVLLPQLKYSRSLRTVDVQSFQGDDGADWSNATFGALPSPAVVNDILAAAPHLRLTVDGQICVFKPSPLSFKWWQEVYRRVTKPTGVV